MLKKKNKTIAVAVSGGVDSAVAAYLLRREGYKVLGVFMDLGVREEGAAEVAKKNCRALDMDFYSLDISSVFKKKIIDYFINAYKEGYTPNPCIKCNQVIKFDELLKASQKLGADHLATGHYCKKTVNKETGEYELRKGGDHSKDQSYFLYTLTQEKLRSVIFPLGAYTKKQVTDIAKKNDLLFEQKESQDICFLSGGLTSFLEQRIPLKRGVIMSMDGEELGHHNGLPLFTPGQRKGLNIGGSGPYYVVGFDHDHNVLYVTNRKNDPALYNRRVEAEYVSWISGNMPPDNLKIKAKVRYNQEEQECTIQLRGKNVVATFKKPLWAVATGQSIVFYNKDRVLGGGIINKAMP
jgi:tRNA-specific 2-thiouridylase